MCITEYDEEKTMQLFKKEFFEEGRAEGRIEGRTEGRIEGRTEGRAEERSKIILNMLRNGMSEQQAAFMTNTPLNEVLRIKNTIM